MCVLPLTRWCDRPLIFFFAISEAQKWGVRFFRHRTTLSAISRAVDGVERRLNVPSHLTLPCASVGYSISALRRAPAELDPSPRCKFPANFLQISGRRRHWALYLAHIDPRRIDRVAEAARRHANPSNIDLIFMDMMCCDVGRMAQLHVRA